MVSTELINLERPRALGTKAEEQKNVRDSLAQLGKGGTTLKLCRVCGKKGGHWSAQCPYQDLVPQTGASGDRPPTSEGTTTVAGSGKNTYVPSGLRSGAEKPGSHMRPRNDENSVRVTNLSEDTREPDLPELFRPFGAVTRVYVALDKETQDFANREDAQKAINKLNGYGYDNLILRVEWATPRTN